jgi:hypothetical protein
LVCRGTVARPSVENLSSVCSLNRLMRVVFGGVIAKFLLNIRFDWADENTPTNITSSQTMKR